MVNYREILRLNADGASQSEIARSLHCSRNTIRDVLKTSEQVGIRWPVDEAVTNDALFGLLFPERKASANAHQEPDYAYIHRELSKPGVNLSLLWTEYCERCYASKATPYMYTQFTDNYRRWARITKATMRIRHKPGEAMQVDWAGNTIPIQDGAEGAETCAYLFVAVLPCSCYVYAEACGDMKTEAWLNCHAHAYTYFGGVTRLLVPDNLKTGIVKNSKYETVINRSYQELAEYYGTAIVPARVKHPQDKSLAEGSVKYASTWIIAALRNQRFFSLNEVKRAVSEKLEELNHYPFKKREGNRHTAYFEEERSFMKPLPLTPYEPAVWSTAKVPYDYLISDGKNKYSVPFDLIGETVDIRLTKETVEVFFQGSRVALHKREGRILRDPVVIPGHMPAEHRKYLSYDAESFLRWASGVGANVAGVIRQLLAAVKEPEQAYKQCVGIRKLGEKYGPEALESACKKLLALHMAPSLRTVSELVKRNGFELRDQRKKPGDNHYGITRGAAYFKQGGEQS